MMRDYHPSGLPGLTRSLPEDQGQGASLAQANLRLPLAWAGKGWPRLAHSDFTLDVHPEPPGSAIEPGLEVICARTNAQLWSLRGFLKQHRPGAPARDMSASTAPRSASLETRPLVRIYYLGLGTRPLVRAPSLAASLFILNGHATQSASAPGYCRRPPSFLSRLPRLLTTGCSGCGAARVRPSKKASGQRPPPPSPPAP